MILERRITEEYINIVELPDHRFLMGECLETVYPVILPHSTTTDSTERKFRVGNMDDGIIDAPATERQPGDNLPEANTGVLQDRFEWTLVHPSKKIRRNTITTSVEIPAE